MLDQQILATIRRATGATHLALEETIQSLWSGYGSIDRYSLRGAEFDSVIVKHVKLNGDNNHPRGWDTDRSHQRKLHSYQVETHWYENWAEQCTTQCRVPHCLLVEERDDEVIMVLEDLDLSGYPVRKNHLTVPEIETCLEWLAAFHARFMLEIPTGLWHTGTYWHLDTRPDEFDAMESGALKECANTIDRRLQETPFQTFVHGDAKLANFCFSKDGSKVAAVDFQYVGGGCGMKDVAYFIGSCLDTEACQRHEAIILSHYFSALREALARYKPEMDSSAVEEAWRPLYALAWTDFYRFLLGWSPDHWKIDRYSKQLADRVISELRSG